MHWHTLNLMPPKGLVFVLFGLCLFREFRNGYFKGFPAHGASQDWRLYARMFSAFLILSILFIGWDSFLLHWIQAQDSPFVCYASALGRTLGYGSYPWLLLVAAYALTRALRHGPWHRITFGCMLSAGLTALAAHVIKVLALRARPYEGSGPFSFFRIQDVWHHSNTYFSFPSGDVAVVAGAFCYLSYRTKNYILKALALFFPMLTACSRIQLNKHWPSDTLLAVGLGFCAGLLVYRFEVKRADSEAVQP